MVSIFEQVAKWFKPDSQIVYFTICLWDINLRSNKLYYLGNVQINVSHSTTVLQYFLIVFSPFYLLPTAGCEPIRKGVYYMCDTTQIYKWSLGWDANECIMYAEIGCKTNRQ